MPLTVIVAVRCVVPVFAAALTVTVPLFAPEDGEKVSHEGASLMTVQFVLEVMLKDCCTASDVKVIVFVDKTNEYTAPVCVTLMVCEVTPVPLMVIVAVRCIVSALAVAVTVTVPLFAPEDGETVSQY